MRSPLLFLLLAFLLPGALYQARNYKAFYIQGEELLEAKNYAQAIEAFGEALRLEPKPGRFREEGVYFRTYTPRYKLALAHESIDALQAETWAKRAEEALEADSIRQKDQQATYHADLKRIYANADAFRNELRNRYDTALREADSLLERNRFQEAKTAYEQLLQIDAERSEAQVGLDQIAPRRENYLRAQGLDAQQALLEDRIEDAEVIAGHMASIDPGSPEVSLLRGRIDAARERVASAAKEAAERTAQPRDESPPTREVVAENRNERPSPPVRRDGPANNNNRQTQQEKTELRAILIESLDPYRKGYPDRALARLEESNLTAAEQSASYHWLTGVYALASYYYAAEPDNSLLQKARIAMEKATKLLPGFEPDPDIYPAYVIEFYKEGQ